jgi:hypothetical protein
VFELLAPDDSHAPTLRPWPGAMPPQQVAALPVLPEAAVRVLPDLELLRAGLVTAERLHPLVAAALAGSAAPAAQPRSGPASAAASAAPPGDPHRVDCRGELHRIGLRDGVLAAIDHDPAQLRREELLVALGGPALPCLRAIDAVHRDPEALPAVRERLGHGDVVGALAVVEGLLGPGALLPDGPLREELERAALGRIHHGIHRSGLHTGQPGTDAEDDGTEPDPRRATARRRPRLNRRTPAVLRRRLSNLARPRSGQTR